MSDYENSPAYLKARIKNEEERRELLATHYHNANLYAVKLRDVLEKIRQAAEFDENPDKKIAKLAKEALDDKLRPPHPLAHFYDSGLHTGHAYPEYLELPMRADHGYVDPHPKKVAEVLSDGPLPV